MNHPHHDEHERDDGDGEHGRRVAALAEQAAEAVRAINHATISGPPMPAPDLYRVLGELAPMAHRLPQALDQLARNLQRSLDVYDVYEDQPDRTPAVQVAATVDALTRAGRHAAALGVLLDHAQLAINGQGHRGRLDHPERPDLDDQDDDQAGAGR